MIDPNTITNAAAQVTQDAAAVKSSLAPWLPALGAAGIFVGREIRNFNAWLKNGLEWVISHGGLGWLFCKLIWNRPVVVEPAERARLQAAINDWNARVATIVSPPAPTDIAPPAPWPRTTAPAEPQPKAPTT